MFSVHGEPMSALDRSDIAEKAMACQRNEIASKAR